MIHANNVINLKKGIISMWDKYRHETKQTICIIGVLTLATKLCKADGHFSEIEEEAILKIIPHDPTQKRILVRITAEKIINAILFKSNLNIPLLLAGYVLEIKLILYFLKSFCRNLNNLKEHYQLQFRLKSY